jgi:Domain of unknown function (DUF955).
MRTYKGPEGDDRIWFDDGDIDTIIDDELRKSGLQPSKSSPAVDLERFIEKHLASHLDLNATLPADTLGQTEFGLNGATRVLVNKDLTGQMEDLETTATLGRWRATLAHEAGHVILHRHLFFLDSSQGRLFGSNPASPKLLRCLKRNVSLSRGTSDWREVQANNAMASLLMPRHLFRTLAIQGVPLLANGQAIAADSIEVAPLVDELAAFFEVSRAATLIRLKTLGMVAGDGLQALSASS